MSNWKIYYSDRNWISSQNATPASILRRVDVQVIIQESEDHGWGTLSSWDYYIFVDRGGGAKWFGVDLFGLHHYLMEPGSKFVLFGTMIDKKKFREIFDLARSDPDFKTKSGYSSDEKRP